MPDKISLSPGSLLRCGGEECVVLDIVDLDSMLVRFGESGQIRTVAISELQPAAVAPLAGPSPRAQRLVNEVLPMVSDKRWAQARLRLAALRDLLNLKPYRRGVAKVEEAARKIGRSPATVYRILADYDESQSLRVLLRLPRSDKGAKKLEPKVDRLIRAVIRKEYLTEQRKMIATVVEAVIERCKKKGWRPPSKTTITRRISELQPREVAQARLGRKAARGHYEMARGKHPDVLYPLDLWQMDHTPSDYCIVDEVFRKPIDGAQTLTVALDINTRCVMGFTLFLEAPSVRVAGACMAHAILPKERFLQEMEVDAVWPCRGRPTVLYTDNASEFEGRYFLMALEFNGIEPRKRPKGAPNYAGHIESLFRTFLKKVHELEGSRFSSLAKRLDYDSTGRAIMTIHEFRQWFTIFITKYYHQKPHSGLDDLPPIKAWERGIIGTGGKPGIGIPDHELDELKLRIDFLPGIRRTVQDYGITIERLKYSDTVLNRWVEAPDPDNPNQSRLFDIKYDPLDMSEIYFLDPELEKYFVIPVVGELEHITFWENKLIRREQRRDNRGQVDNNTISEGLDEMREVRQEAAHRTKTARRAQQRVIESQRHSVPRQRRAAEEETRAQLESADPAESPKTDPVEEDDDVLTPLPGAVPAVALRGQ
jgi:putative transposase